MSTREDRRGRLPQQLLDRELCVGALAQRVRTLLDERLDERPVLVQGGLLERGVFLERERKVGALFDLREQRAEGPEAEGPKGGEELRSAYGHACAYAVGGPSPLWQPGHQYAIRASSPCGHDSIGVPQRGHAWP